MVFEALLVEVLNRFLGPYVKNLDASQLKVGIWGGDVVLNQLEMKENALDDINLPIRIFGGNLGKLHLKIPWKNLYSAPVVAEIDGLYMLAGPASAAVYDPQKAAKELKESKDRELKKIESARKRSNELTKEEQSDPGFVEKLVTQIIKNIQITVKNIHLCYEDSTSSPFSCGVTLDSLFVQSTDDLYNVSGTPVDSPVSHLIYKLVEMNCLSVYWNSRSKLVGFDLPVNWKEILSSKIASSKFTPPDRDYVLGPITAKAKLQLTMKPGVDMKIPQALAHIMLDQITIALQKQQYQDIISLIESLDRMSINQKYLKYRPSLPLMEDMRGWWRYAITAMLEEDVKRRTRMWSWKHIKKHRNVCKEYIELYLKKLLSPKSDLQTQLDELEMKLDVFNITLCRQLAGNKAQRQLKKDQEKAATEGWLGWASNWLTGGDSNEGDVADIKPPTESELQAEKEKLYEALGYSEGMKLAAYPKEYVTQKIEFHLNQVSVKLSNDEGSIAGVVAHKVGVDVSVRSSAGGLGISAKLGSISMTGHSIGQAPPEIITTKRDPSATLLSVNFDLQPLESKADQQIRVQLEPIQVIYDAETVDAIIGMFLLPKDVQLQNLSANAASTLEDIKTQTRAGLEHVIEKRKLLDVAVSVRSPYLIIPENGAMRNSKNVLVADLGLLKMTSDMKYIVPSVRDASLKELEGAFYDHFNLSLSDVQIIVARTTDDWNGARTDSKSPFHILRPTGLGLALHKSLLPNDTKLPNIKIQGKLPELMLSLSDKKIKQTLRIIQSIPIPPPSLANKPKTSTYSFDGGRPSLLDDTNRLLESILTTPQVSAVDSDSSDDEWFDAEEGESDDAVVPSRPGTTLKTGDTAISSTKLTINFSISKVGIHFSEYSKTKQSETPLLNFDLHSLSAMMKQTTWQLSAGVTLQYLLVEDFYNPDKPVPILVAGRSKEKRFLDFVYEKYDPTSPQYQSIQQFIALKLSTITFKLPLESMTNLVAIGQDIIKSSKAFNVETANLGNELVTSYATTVAKTEEKETTIPGEKTLYVMAQFEGLELTLCDIYRDVMTTDIKNLATEISMYKEHTDISLRMRSFSLTDPDGLHSNVVQSVDTNQNIVTAEVTLNSTVHQEDLNSADLSISAKFRRIQVVLVFRFVNRIISYSTRFLKQLKLDQKTINSARDAAAKRASQTAEAIRERSSNRVKVSLEVEAPVLMLPLSATSNNGFILDFGCLKLNNKFVLASSLAGSDADATLLAPPSGPAVVVDQMVLSLSSVQLGRTDDLLRIENSGTKKVIDHVILKPLELSGSINRSLSDENIEIPAIDVRATLESMEVLFSPEDFQAVTQMLDSIKDGKDEEEDIKEEDMGKVPGEESVQGDKKSVEGHDNKSGEEECGVERSASKIRVLATIGIINLLLHSSESGQLASVTVKELSTQVNLQQDQTRVSAGISDVNISDLSPESRYPKVVSTVVEGRKALITNITVYSGTTKNSLDVTRYDLSVSASLAQLRITILFLFINKMLDFLKRFNLSKDTIESAKKSAQDGASAAVTAVQEQHNTGTRIKLDISIDAPVIVLPLRSDSDHVIVADFGKLTLSNSFSLTKEAGKDHPSTMAAIVETYDIKLSNLQVSRTFVDSFTSNGEEAVPYSQILLPFNLAVRMKRNMSSSWYHNIPSINLNAKFQTLKMVASGDDIESLCQILTGNLREGSVKMASAQKKESNMADLPPDSGDLKQTLPGEGMEDYTALLLSASLQSIEIELYKSSGSFEKVKADCLAGLTLSQFKASTQINNNGAMTASLLMTDCVLDDKRPDAREMTSRMIKQSLEMATTTLPPLIAVKFSKTQWNEIKVSAKVSGAQVLVDMGFIMMLVDFMKNSTQSLTAASQSELMEPNITDDSMVLQKSSIGKQLPDDSKLQPKMEQDSKVALNVVIEKPLIALLENTSAGNPQALVLQTELIMNVNQKGENSSFNATLSELRIASTHADCLRNTSTEVLTPIDTPVWASMSKFIGRTVVNAEVPSLSLTFSPTTVRLILSVLETFKTTDKKDEEIPDTFPSNLWSPQPIDRSRWYMVPAKEVDIPAEGDPVDIPLIKSEVANEESMKLVVKSISVAIEKELPNGRSLPVILIKMGNHDRKAFDMNMYNWNSKLSATAYTSMVISYYSLIRDVWEPILEPIMDPKDDEAPPILWFMKMKISKPSPGSSSSDVTGRSILPELFIKLTTDNALQLTLTKSSLGLMKALLEVYQEKGDHGKAVEEVDSYVPEVFSPIYTITNMLGSAHEMKVQGKGSIKVHGAAVPIIRHKEKLDLFPVGDYKYLKPGEVLSRNSYLSRVHVVILTIYGFHPVSIALGSKQHAYYSLISQTSSTSHSRGAQQTSSSVGIVVDIDRRSKFRVPQVIVRSPLMVLNKLAESVQICVTDGPQHLPTAQAIASISSGGNLYLPLEYAGRRNSAIFIKPEGENAEWTQQALTWTERRVSKDISYTVPGGKCFYIYALREEENYERSHRNSDVGVQSSESFILFYPLMVQNLLPFDLKIIEKYSTDSKLISPGEIVPFNTINLMKEPVFTASLTYAGIKWSSDFSSGPPKAEQLSVHLKPQRSSSVDDNVDVNLNTLASSDIFIHVMKELDETWYLSFYSPYWIVNKTGLTLQYAMDVQGTITTHFPDVPIALYPFNKAQVRVLLKDQVTSDWSKPFSLDATGTEGIFQCICTSTNLEYQMGTKVQMSSTGLSKVITISPRFLAYNKTKSDINLILKDDKLVNLSLMSEELVPLWPSENCEWVEVSMNVANGQVKSKPFKFKDNASLLLRMGTTSGLTVEVQVTGSANVLTFLPYYDGCVPLQLVNDIEYSLEFKQEGESVCDSYIVMPGTSLMYAWDFPDSNYVLTWQVKDTRRTKEMVNLKPKDGHGIFSVATDRPSIYEDTVMGTDTKAKREYRASVGTVTGKDSEVTEKSKLLGVVEEAGGTSDSSGEEYEVSETMGVEPDGACADVEKKRLFRKVTQKTKDFTRRLSDTIQRPKRKNQASNISYWISFLDGLQRVIIFTNNAKLCQHILGGNVYENPKLDIILSVQSVGVSLVNDILGLEVAYIGITHSQPIWEEKRRWNYYKAVNNVVKELLEEEYSKAKENGTTKRDIAIPKTDLVVNFSDIQNVVLTEKGGKRRILRRSRYEGVYVDLSYSSSQTSIKASINAIQIDNHLPYSANPTILYPYPLPPAITSKYAPKPFIEASVIFRHTKQSNATDFELFQVLVQELGINVDMSFILATFNILSDIPTEKTKSDLIQEDLAMTKQPLKETEMVQVSAAASRNYFKILHLSPLHVHLSFSLERNREMDESAKSTSRSNPIFGVIISALSQFGVLIGQTKGTELRLGYFQLEEVALTQTNLTQRITKHYIQQAALQIYRVLLGLEVLGNPVGFVKGLKDGTIGLFYHPIKGAVLGPGEFFQGLALGSKLFVEGSVGGVAGALGKVVGVLGDGAAKLAFDSGYQEDRRRAGSLSGSGAAKEAAKGVVAGVTGVISQPIEGAIEGGLWGFVKGAGKGVIGFVVRPTVGLLDLASASLNTIQKKTQVGDTEVSQVRPARYIGPEKVIYPYSPVKAIGYAVFMNSNNGKLAETDYFFDFVELTENPVKAVLITSKRFAFVKSTTASKFEEEFNFRFEEFADVIKTEDNVVIATLEETAGLLGFGRRKVVKRTLRVRTSELANKVKILVNQAYEEYRLLNKQ